MAGNSEICKSSRGLIVFTTCNFFCCGCQSHRPIPDHTIVEPTPSMPSTRASDRKRKPTAEVPEAVVRSDDQSKSKARRVSTDAQAATIASDETNEEVTTANAESVYSMESIGQMIQDLSNSDNAKVLATLLILILDLDEDKRKWENIQAVGGCHAIVQLVKNCLDRVIARIPACDFDKVTATGDLPELETIDKSLNLILSLTYHLGGRTVASIGGVEAVVKTMKTFPNCQNLQETACCVLGNLLFCSIGQKKALETDAMGVLLDALENHLDADTVCANVCFTLHKIVAASKENTELFISSGGVTTVAKVREEWPDDDMSHVHEAVRKLMEPVVKQLSCWTQAKK
jgi:hypothetical protein